MLDKAKAGIKITRRNSNNLRNIDEVIAHLMRLLLILSPLWQKARKSKRLLLKVKDESKKIGLKFNRKDYTQWIQFLKYISFNKQACVDARATLKKESVLTISEF